MRTFVFPANVRRDDANAGRAMMGSAEEAHPAEAQSFESPPLPSRKVDSDSCFAAR